MTEVSRSASGAEQRVAEPWVTRQTLRRAESDGEIDAQDGIDIGYLWVQIHRLGVVAKGIVGSEGSERPVAGLPRVGDRLPGVGGLRRGEPVMGELFDPGAGLPCASSSSASPTRRWSRPRRVASAPRRASSG